MAPSDSRQMRLAAALCLLLLLVAAGCGSAKQDGHKTASAAPSKVDFIIKAEALCRRRGTLRRAAVRRYVAAHTRNGNPYTHAERVGEIDAASLPGIRAEARELEALQPPAGEVERIQELIAALRKAIARTQRHPELIFSPATNPFRHVSELARSYGFVTCARY